MNQLLNKRGSLALEMALAIGVLSLIVMAGMGAIRWQLENSLKQLDADQAWLDLESFRRSVEGSWDHRCDHALRVGPWLEVESSTDAQFRNLQRLWILHFDDNGSLVESTWSRAAKGWKWILTKDVDGTAEHEIQSFHYDGRIRINLESGEFHGGEGPSLILFNFPDMHIPRLRQGFAIRRFW